MQVPVGSPRLSQAHVNTVVDAIEDRVGPLERRRDVGNLVKLAYGILCRDALRAGSEEVEFTFFELGFRIGRDANTAREVVLGRKPRRRRSKTPGDATADTAAQQRGMVQIKVASVLWHDERSGTVRLVLEKPSHVNWPRRYLGDPQRPLGSIFEEGGDEPGDEPPAPLLGFQVKTQQETQNAAGFSGQNPEAPDATGNGSPEESGSRARVRAVCSAGRASTLSRVVLARAYARPLSAPICRRRRRRPSRQM